MAKGPTARDFAEHTTERAMQMGNEGMDWMRVIAEQSLNLSKAALEGYLATARKTADTMNIQASEFRERSLSLANEALSHTFEFANQVMHVKDPQEVLRLQSEFLSRQVHTLAERTNELGQLVAQGVNAASRTAAEQIRSAAE
ncbi:MAG TPA: phasin family protein [Xanthobacteraceae bacterium]